MKWLEIIEIRSAGNRRKLIDSQFRHLIKDAQKDTRDIALKIYKDGTIDTDFSIQLFHNTGEVKHQGSALGQRLASTLKEFGIVNHRVLIEIHEE